MWKSFAAAASAFALSCLIASGALRGESKAIPSAERIDAEVKSCLEETQAKGLALAVIDGGKLIYLKTFGVRNTRGEPLTPQTVMYGASLTKTVVAYTALKLVDEGKLTLDKPIAEYLEKPLADYPPDAKHSDYAPLRDDPRWQKITPRMCLTHSTGFANFGFLEPDEKLRIHFEPGSRYAYSGEGILLLQFAIENGLKRDLGALTQNVFDELGMAHTSLIWRKDFAENLADGWDDHGKPVPHDDRSRVRAAGSMDTTLEDLAKFALALVQRRGLSVASRDELARPQLKITTAHQFPTLLPELPAREQRSDLHAGLGVVVFQGPQGSGFFKGGHDHITANLLVVLEDSRRAVLLLANDVRAEATYARLVSFILGETGMPFDWEYGDYAGKS